MITINSILKKIDRLALRRGKYSISTEEIFEVMTDITLKQQETIENSAISMNHLGSKDRVINLPQNANKGDAWFVEETGYIHQFDGEKWNQTSFTVPPRDVLTKENLTGVEGDDPTKVVNQVAWTDLAKIGNVRNWKRGNYKKDEIVRHNGLLWVSAIDGITVAEPSAHESAWKLYNPFGKPYSLLVSHSSTLTIDLVDNKVTFSGSSTNRIITSAGFLSISAQTVDFGTNTYFGLVYNKGTGSVRAVAVADDIQKSLSYNDYPFAFVLRLNNTIKDVYGIKGYTLVETSGTTSYPLNVGSQNVLYNHIFSKYATSRTNDEKVWLNKAIVDIECYNISDSQTIVLYGLGKNYTGQSYLGFIIAEEGKNNVFLYADEFTNKLNIPYDADLHSGIKTYFLKSSSDSRNHNTKTSVTIDWDAIPDKTRVLEANVGVLVGNSHVLRSKYIKSDIYNNLLGFVKFARPKGADDYYNAPIIESYSSASGVHSMIPKEPYKDCEQWLLKWDELVTNCPKGYTITKRLLTDQVPTDTTSSGFLSMYSYNFKPNDLKSGDSTVNNKQTMPKILINCSIHGFEKIPSFITYELMREILFNWKSNPFIEYLRYNIEFSIIPFANPHGWNVKGGVGTRVNFNGVDLNRNFTIGWALSGSLGDATYSGVSPASEIETQAIERWMSDETREGTIIGIDYHNFHGSEQSDPKNYNLNWIINTGSELAQSCSNLLFKELSVKYKEKSQLIPQDEDYFVGTSNNSQGGGQANTAYKMKGALCSVTFESAQNFRFDSNFKGFDSNAMTFGLEGFTNFLRVYLSNFIDEYNRVK